MIIVGATGTGVGIAFDNRRVVDAGKYHRVTLHKTNMCGRELLPKILKARINSIGKARENSIVEKDAKKIKKC